MDGLATALLLAGLAGGMIPTGALLARYERIRPQWLELEFRHSVMAFGGGVLLAAVSFVLIPKGIETLSPAVSMAAIGAGGIVFLWLDRRLARGGRSPAQLVAMIADFVPEAIALGALLASGDPAAPLLALLIGLQNLPEGFNAYRELLAAGRRPPAELLIWFAALVPIGPAAAFLGNIYLSDRPEIIGAVMLFAAGGILYLIFQDVAPQARLERHWAPPLGAVLGFMFGLLGHMLIG